MKIIFLDIDGVLNFYSSRKAVKMMICQDRMMMVADLARRTKAQIVISSTWRLGTSIKYFQEIFWHMTALYPSRYYSFNNYSDDCERLVIIDKTPRFSGCIRGLEIQYWLEAHAGMVNNYVIIDDDADMLPHQLETHFVKTNGFKGITKEDITNCERILNNG